MSKHLLPLIPPGLLVREVLPAPDALMIVATFRERTAACPNCGAPSGVVHSRYERRLHNLPWQGRRVTLRIQARRLRCSSPDCQRQTFAERLSDSAPAAARRTRRLAALQRHLGLALGGEAGGRLATRLTIPVSADTLIRMARRPDQPPEPALPLGVLRVDDLAWRRGRRYGSILVDLERNRVLHFLPDRQAETLGRWLGRHPGIEVVARSRACAYAESARQGAPGAVQVADRWHLLRNLGDAVQAVVERHHAAIRRIGREMTADRPVRAAAVAPSRATPFAAQRRKEAGRLRRQARYEEAARMHVTGASVSDIARHLGIDARRSAAGCWPGLPRAGSSRGGGALSMPTAPPWNSARRRAATTPPGCGGSWSMPASPAAPRRSGPGPRSGAGESPRHSCPKRFKARLGSHPQSDALRACFWRITKSPPARTPRSLRACWVRHPHQEQLSMPRDASTVCYGGRAKIGSMTSSRRLPPPLSQAS
jgi:transposase